MTRTRRLLLQASLVASMGAIALVTAPTKAEAADEFGCYTIPHCEMDCLATNDAMCNTCMGGKNEICVVDPGCESGLHYQCGYAS